MLFGCTSPSASQNSVQKHQDWGVACLTATPLTTPSDNHTNLQQQERNSQEMPKRKDQDDPEPGTSQARKGKKRKLDQGKLWNYTASQVTLHQQHKKRIKKDQKQLLSESKKQRHSMTAKQLQKECNRLQEELFEKEVKLDRLERLDAYIILNETEKLISKWLVQECHPFLLRCSEKEQSTRSVFDERLQSPLYDLFAQYYPVLGESGEDFEPMTFNEERSKAGGVITKINKRFEKIDPTMDNGLQRALTLCTIISDIRNFLAHPEVRWVDLENPDNRRVWANCLRPFLKTEQIEEYLGFLDIMIAAHEDSERKKDKNDKDQ